jgi:hypothetical protein
MSATLKLRWKRLVNKITYLHEENDYLQDIIEKASAEFNQHYDEFCKKLEIDIQQLNSDNEKRIRRAYGIDEAPQGIQQTTQLLQDIQQMIRYTQPPVYTTQEDDEDDESDEGEAPNEYQMTQDEKEMHDSFNKLFRRLAMELHPDKLSKIKSDEERQDKVEKFNSAKQALDKKQYHVLLEIANELNVTTPKNYKQQIRWMKAQIVTLENSVNAAKQTYNYLFSECETEEEKDDLVARFMRQLFGINIQKTIDE